MSRLGGIVPVEKLIVLSVAIVQRLKCGGSFGIVQAILRRSSLVVKSVFHTSQRQTSITEVMNGFLIRRI